MNVSWGQLGIMVAIGAHMVATVWWAATMTANLKNVATEIQRLNSELVKRDDQISTIWKRLDELKERIMTGKYEHPGA